MTFYSYTARLLEMLEDLKCRTQDHLEYLSKDGRDDNPTASLLWEWLDKYKWLERESKG